MIHPTAVIGEPPQHRDHRDAGRGIPPVIAASARIEAFASVDRGVDRATRVGERSWLMKYAHVGHDALVGDDCEIGVGVVLCGYVIIEDGARLGVNASVLPFRRVGAGARIGAGAVVNRDVPAGEVWAGVPARRLVGAGLAATVA